jgi:hypothetical protein
MERRVVNCRFAAGGNDDRAPLRVATATPPRDDDFNSDDDERAAAKRANMTVLSVQRVAVDYQVIRYLCANTSVHESFVTAKDILLALTLLEYVTFRSSARSTTRKKV